MNLPEELKYTKDHEWIKIDGNIITVGITDFAQGELGEIVYVEIETLDEDLIEGDVLGSIEAVKTVSDIFMPISGVVTEINNNLEENPELVNSDPYEDGWIAKIEFSNTNAKEIDHLLSSTEYADLISS